MKLTILTEVPSNNQLLRMHWAARKNLKAVFIREIWAQLIEKARFPVLREKKKKSVTVTLYRRGRRYDKPNAYGGADKMIVDSLVELGIIWNDSRPWLDLTVQQELDHKNPRTEIEISE